ncbi:Uu.00g142800.m01.CDS01 [Anthostomella pinea]|uniref:Uu.00g142800.m01.CDS01 n=1 Tax=Anthostomella pinea TaxID=933095 RepID=A0AAI8VRC8_9PEZI|nr:Uu.00g142800.m01.CDS01 [Anthostomella pinea]
MSENQNNGSRRFRPAIENLRNSRDVNRQVTIVNWVNEIMRDQRQIREWIQRLQEGVDVIEEISDENSEDIQELRLGQNDIKMLEEYAADMKEVGDSADALLQARILAENMEEHLLKLKADVEELKSQVHQVDQTLLIPLDYISSDAFMEKKLSSPDRKHRSRDGSRDDYERDKRNRASHRDAHSRHQDRKRSRSRDHSRERKRHRRSRSPDDSRRRRSRSRDRERDSERAHRSRRRSRDHDDKHSDRASHRRRARDDAHDDQDRGGKQIVKRSGPLPSQDVSFALTTGEEAPKPKEKPNFGNTGSLAAASNAVTQADGSTIVLKYHEPPEARKPAPKDQWKLFVFKGDEIIDTVPLSSRSCWLVGRELAVVDMAAEHPSISKQHAVIQFRYLEKRNEYGDKIGKVKPYLIDLESANGTMINSKKVPESRYLELRDKDMIQFGQSTREYVLMLAPKD